MIRKNVYVGDTALKQYRKEIRNHWKEGFGETIAQAALLLEEEKEPITKRNILCIRVQPETWEKLKKKAIEENTTISKLYERTLWERSET